MTTTSAPWRATHPDGVFPADCPTRALLERVTSKWGVLVLMSLSEGEPLRWSELRRRADGVSEKMLAQTLKGLAAEGLVHREARPVVPPHVEYSLTPDGEELGRLLMPLMGWIGERAEATAG